MYSTDTVIDYEKMEIDLKVKIYQKNLVNDDLKWLSDDLQRNGRTGRHKLLNDGTRFKIDEKNTMIFWILKTIEIVLSNDCFWKKNVK